MGITLTQHYDHVNLDSKGVINSIAIEYAGKMAIEMNVDIRKAKMINNKIIIFFYKGTEINDTLFTYTGWLAIKNARCYGIHGRSMASVRLIDSTYPRLNNKWEETGNTWEFYDDYIGKTNERRRSLTYNYKGLKMKRTPKFRGR